MPVPSPSRLRATFVALLVAAVALALFGAPPASAAPEARTRVVVIYKDRPAALSSAERSSRTKAYRVSVSRTYSRA